MILRNFATSRSILAALDSSTISRLQQTWGVRFDFFLPIVVLCMIFILFCRVCRRSKSCSLTVFESSPIMLEIITSIAHACVKQSLPLFRFWVRSLDSGINIFVNLPQSGLYLTDITFCREGNPSHRASPLAAEKKLINFSKYHKMARIVQGNKSLAFSGDAQV